MVVAAGRSCVDNRCVDEVLGAHRRRGHVQARLSLVLGLTVALVANLLVAVPVPAVATPPKPLPPHQFPSVHGRAAKPVNLPRPHDDAAKSWTSPTVSWPKAGRGRADLSAARAGVSDAVTSTGRVVTSGAVAATVPAGTLPVRVGAAGADAPPMVDVAMADHAGALRAGVNGLLFTVQAANPDNARTVPGATVKPVSVSVDYTSFAGAFGGDYARRLRLVTMPACALTTPTVPACQTQTVVAGGGNNALLKTLIAQVALPIGPGNGPAGTVVLAATAAPAGAAGDYTATPMKPSGSWTAGGSSGTFSYSYPVTVPSVPGGLAPGVSLSYDSQSVDGEQVATNNQSSWIGDGWSYSPGYVERSYVACKDDPIGGGPNTGDSCWAGQVVHVAFGSTSGDL
ncbi:MAG: hypothetical protein QOI74_1279, partial [Micromonosporaceae bacterium]|nr:hypothetical protein [Micromonosporaceae bacterium]